MRPSRVYCLSCCRSHLFSCLWFRVRCIPDFCLLFLSLLALKGQPLSSVCELIAEIYLAGPLPRLCTVQPPVRVCWDVLESLQSILCRVCTCVLVCMCICVSGPADLSVRAWTEEWGLRRELEEEQKTESGGSSEYCDLPRVYYSKFLWTPIQRRKAKTFLPRYKEWTNLITCLIPKTSSSHTLN